MSAEASGAEIELGSLVDRVRQTFMPEELPADSIYVGLDCIEPNAGRLLKQSIIADVTSRVTKFNRGDILYSRMRPYLRKAVVVDFDGYASPEVLVLRPSARIHGDYLLMLLLSQHFTNYANERATGDRPRVSFDTIAGYRARLPTIEKQKLIRRMDRALAECASKLAAVLDASQTATEFAVDQVRSLLLWGGSPSDEPVPLADLLTAIDYGTSVRSTYELSRAVPVLRIPNIAAGGNIDGSDLKYAPMDERELEKYRVNEGDLLIVRSNGSLSLLGRSAMVTSEYDGYAFAGYLVRVRPIPSVSSEYLLELFQSVEFINLVRTSPRSSSGIFNLSASQLASFHVPNKAREEQDNVGAHLSRLRIATRSLQSALAVAHNDVVKLREQGRALLLGQSVETRQEVVPDREKVGPKPPSSKKAHTSSTEEIDQLLLSQLDKAPALPISFGALYEEIVADYDTVRDAVFKMLQSHPPVLAQEWDGPTGTILLRRSA
ncbi:hypothetical protein [Microbacterium sp. Mcb102]|uniref:restriction endonuclease subunit S n=1 Tax=Microbacterium sp. Mcb102 TaxID=2926012 RepID=UPI0021C9674C|nr:hypothetical protein [Microbacterium sp. Mcb102]